MDPTKYKDIKVQRGYNYHYYYSPASEGKPTLFFIHGFPSSSFDWSRQVAFFQPKGYGILVPDCLGYGGTSKPTNHEEFRWKLIAQDLIDILDAENLVSNVIGIGHDWGSLLLSTLVHYHQHRFVAFAFVVLAYRPPIPHAFDLDATLENTMKQVGSNVWGYWAFFNRPEAHVVCEKNIDSLIQLMYPPTPETWLEWLSPVGKAQEWVESGRQPGRAPWLSEQEYGIMRETLSKSGFKSALNYYKLYIANVNLADHQAIPEEAWHVKKPTLFVTGQHDVVCRASFGKVNIAKYAPHAQIVELDTGHWAQFEATAELNNALDKWLGTLNLKFTVSKL